jgi:hypothetical protein
MKSWSESLIEQSKLYLQIDGVNVKSINGQFGILNINYQNRIYTINILTSNQSLTFHSVDELINAGWVVD